MNSIRNILKKIYNKLIPPFVKNIIDFYRIFNRFPSFKNKKYFNEKIMYRKFFDRNYLYSYCSDKFLVRNFISREIGADYLIPLIYTTDKPSELIELVGMSHCVIKPNHGAGMVKIVGDTPLSIKDVDNLISEAECWMRTDFSKKRFEPHYEKITRKILVEESICTNGVAPTDYKFHCFKQIDGSVEMVLQVIDDRFGDDTKQEFYLNSLDNCIKRFCNTNKGLIPEENKPFLEKAMELNIILASNFNYVRIDWYVSADKLYFGELTFTAGSGLSRSFGDDLEILMSKLWVL